MSIFQWTENEISGISILGIEKIWTDVDKNGVIKREIGFDRNDLVVYKFPSNLKYGKYGLFDNSTVEKKFDKSEIDAAIFNSFWEI